MTKRTIATAAAGVLAGAALIGVPGLAWASQPGAQRSQNHDGQSSDMGAMMADPQFQDQMTTFMSEMMSDAELQQMHSMMSDAMPSMDGMTGMQSTSGMNGPGMDGADDRGEG